MFNFLFLLKKYNPGNIQTKHLRTGIITIFCISVFVTSAFTEGTRLLRQPTMSSGHIVFVYGGDLWMSDLDSKEVHRLTGTPAVESDPHFSPDGRLITFTSNRSGVNAVYTLPIAGGTWQVADTGAPVKNNGKKLSINLNIKLDRLSEWQQIFEEAWRY